MDKTNDDNLAEKMHQDAAAEMRSNADSDFVQTELADFANDEQPQEKQQPNSCQHQNVLDWSLGQNSTANYDDWKTVALQNKCAFLQERMKNVEREAQYQREKEKDRKKILQLEEKLWESQKLATMMDAANIDEKMKQLKCYVLMINRELQMEQKKAGARIGLLEDQLAEMGRKAIGKDAKVATIQSRMNKWDQTTTGATILGNGLIAAGDGVILRPVFAVLPFSFADGQYTNHGILLNYYEVKADARWGGVPVGLSADNSPRGDGIRVGEWASSYSIEACTIGVYYFAGTRKEHEWPPEAYKPRIANVGEGRNVLGCGLVTWPNGKKRSIFFTANGILLGKHIPIPVDGPPLYPALSVTSATVEANFGDNPAVPFVYDIAKCPGLGFGPE